ncbi:RDD family protein [mine drainage metagenome]|uniref:RDD family protein n=2 Tax=mine drainage metagenome TaxID=410659 RepID=T1D234_9ZZZZ
MNHPVLKKPFWGRILACLFYDGLLILAFWLLGTFLLALLVNPEHHDLDNGITDKLLYWIFLLGLPWLFLTWFWIHGGQTLGMKAWRLRLQDHQGQAVRLGAASIRFAVACIEWLAIGILLLPLFWLIVSVAHDWSMALTAYLTGWIVVVFLTFAWSSQLKHGSLHDHLSKTQLIQY